MRKAASISLFLLVLLGCSGAASTERQYEDAIVAERVREALKNDSALARFTVNVSVREGLVTLTGAVDSQSTISRATRIAETVAGVRSVENLLTIGGISGVP